MSTTPFTTATAPSRGRRIAVIVAILGLLINVALTAALYWALRHPIDTCPAEPGVTCTTTINSQAELFGLPLSVSCAGFFVLALALTRRRVQRMLGWALPATAVLLVGAGALLAFRELVFASDLPAVIDLIPAGTATMVLVLFVPYRRLAGAWPGGGTIASPTHDHPRRP